MGRFINWLAKKFGVVKEGEVIQPMAVTRRIQTTQEPVELAQTQPVAKVLAHKRARKGRKSQKRLVYRDAEGNLLESKDGAAVKRVAAPKLAVPRQPGERRASLMSYRPPKFSAGMPRITPKMPRIG